MEKMLRHNSKNFQLASVVYIESPAGVGYSYSTNGSVKTNDDQVDILNSFFKFNTFLPKPPTKSLISNHLYQKPSLSATIFNLVRITQSFSTKSLLSIPIFSFLLKSIKIHGLTFVYH